METVPITATGYVLFGLTLTLAFIALVGWIFRSSAAETYEEYGKIPLKGDEPPHRLGGTVHSRLARGVETSD